MKSIKDLSELKSFLVKEGSIFFMHESILNFGNLDDWHYALCYTKTNSSFIYAGFNPCTSQKHSNKIKTFKIRFEDDTDIEGTGRDTYILLSQIRKISIANCIDNNVSKYKGRLKQEVWEAYRKAYKTYIRSQYKKRNSA